MTMLTSTRQTGLMKRLESDNCSNLHNIFTKTKNGGTGLIYNSGRRTGPRTSPRTGGRGVA